MSSQITRRPKSAVHHQNCQPRGWVVCFIERFIGGPQISTRKRGTPQLGLFGHNVPMGQIQLSVTETRMALSHQVLDSQLPLVVSRAQVKKIEPTLTCRVEIIWSDSSVIIHVPPAGWHGQETCLPSRASLQCPHQLEVALEQRLFAAALQSTSLVKSQGRHFFY